VKDEKGGYVIKRGEEGVAYIKKSLMREALGVV